jgi:hypothetical protein
LPVHHASQPDPASGWYRVQGAVAPLRPLLSLGSHNFALTNDNCEVISSIVRKRIPRRCRNVAESDPYRDQSRPSPDEVRVTVPPTTACLQPLTCAEYMC